MTKIDESAVDMMRLGAWFLRQQTRPTMQDISAHFGITTTEARRYYRLWLRAATDASWDRRYWVATKLGKVMAALIDDDMLTSPGQLSDFLQAMESRGYHVERRLYKEGSYPIDARHLDSSRARPRYGSGALARSSGAQAAMLRVA